MNGDFEAALQQAENRLTARDSIGRLQEKRLHATLKFWLDADETHHEVPLSCGAVADIFDGERVYEIQNGNFSPFRVKLTRLLEQYPVTVVFPLVREKTVFWVDPQTGERSGGRRSPKRGTFADALPELLFIEKLLFHPRLTLRLQMVDVEEYRIQDGWGDGGKRGSHRLERVPVQLGETLDITQPRDLIACIPAKLPDTFDAKQYTRCTLQRGRRLHAALHLLVNCGILTREKQGKKYLYTVSS